MLGLLRAGQALYYGTSALVAIGAYGTFEQITGPKAAPWLVKSVAALTAVIGLVIGLDTRGRSPQTRRLALGSALAFAAIDIRYAGLRRRIRRIYLADALIEALFVIAWLVPRRPARFP